MLGGNTSGVNTSVGALVVVVVNVVVVVVVGLMVVGPAPPCLSLKVVTGDVIVAVLLVSASISAPKPPSVVATVELVIVSRFMSLTVEVDALPQLNIDVHSSTLPSLKTSFLTCFNCRIS
jgi:hypothetical protein